VVAVPFLTLAALNLIVVTPMSASESSIFLDCFSLAFFATPFLQDKGLADNSMIYGACGDMMSIGVAGR
jgi:hypothetical protein